jgi:hypothetical protein
MRQGRCRAVVQREGPDVQRGEVGAAFAKLNDPKLAEKPVLIATEHQ